MNINTPKVWGFVGNLKVPIYAWKPYTSENKVYLKNDVIVKKSQFLARTRSISQFCRINAKYGEFLEIKDKYYDIATVSNENGYVEFIADNIEFIGD